MPQPALQTAKGHVAKIVPFDDATVLFPLNANEARRLYYAIEKQIEKLKRTGDFPEEQEYENLHSNLMTACWLLSVLTTKPHTDAGQGGCQGG